MELIDVIYILLGFLVFFIIFDLTVWRPNVLKRESETLRKELKKANKPMKKVWKRTRGIVMQTESPIFLDTLFTIFCLRRINCNLPIYIVGDSLKEKEITVLKSIKNLKFEPGYFTVSSAIINSPFKETLFITPGTVFFYNPENLFQNRNYNETGALFWRSPKKQIWGNSLQNFIRSLVSYQIDHNPILTKSGGHCCDGRTMVINKEIHRIGLNKLGLLENSDAFNNNPDECFWIAFELSKEPYYFIENPKKCSGGDLFLDDNGSVCWLVTDPHSPDSLDIKSYSNFADTPINYFKKSFNNENNMKLETELTKEETWLLNEYRKIIHDLN